jgi:hypothetical protein
MPIRKYKTNIEKGKLLITDPLQDRLNMLTEKEVYVTITTPKKNRSLNQNAYYWILLDLLSDELGYTSDEMHTLCRQRFLKKFINVKGKELCTTKSTTELSTVEFEEYTAKIRQWASIDFSLYLPLPNEVV